MAKKFWENDPLARSGSGGKFWEQDPISDFPVPEARPAEITPTNIFTGTGYPKLEAAANTILETAEKVPGLGWLLENRLPGELEGDKSLQDMQTGAAIDTLSNLQDVRKRMDAGERFDPLTELSASDVGIQKAQEAVNKNIKASEDLRKQIAAQPKSEFTKNYQKAKSADNVQDYLKNSIDAIESDPLGAAKSLTGTVVAGVPALAAMVFGGPYGGAFYGFNSSYNQAILDETVKRGGNMDDPAQFMKVYKANKDEIKTAAKEQGSVSGAFDAALGAIPGSSTLKGVLRDVVIGTGLGVGKGATQRYLDKIPVIDPQTGSPMVGSDGKVVMQDAPPMTAAEWADLTAQSAASGIPVALLAAMRTRPEAGAAPTAAPPAAGKPPAGLEGPRPQLPGPEAPAAPPSPARPVEAPESGAAPAPEAPPVAIPPDVQQAIDTLTAVENAQKLITEYETYPTVPGHISAADMKNARNIIENYGSPEQIQELKDKINNGIAEATGQKPPEAPIEAPSAKAQQLVEEGVPPLQAMQEAAAEPVTAPTIEKPAAPILGEPTAPQLPEAVAPAPEAEAAPAPKPEEAAAPVAVAEAEAPTIPFVPVEAEEKPAEEAAPPPKVPEEGNLTEPTSESPVSTEEAIVDNVAPPEEEQDNIDKLSNAFEPVLGSDGFKDITQARKIAKDTVGNEDNKLVEEAMELAVVKQARKIVDEKKPTLETYDRLVDLYNKQPNLATRTSTSVLQQAYSTPIPLAYAASRLAGIDKNTSVLEPTAGNGALLIESDQKNAFANELNAVRRRNLEKQGFKPTGHDAAMIDQLTPNKSAQVIITNPPFGTVKDEDGLNKVFNLDFIQEGYKTKEIDHAIALKSLQEMDADGRAVLIIGSVNPQSKEREDAYNGKAKREFFKTLYDNYKVKDHFTVDGKLYSKQGASWPVDVIVIDGKGKTEDRKLPAVKAPEMITSWDQLKEKLANEYVRNEERPVRPPVQPVEQPVEEGAGAGTSGAGAAPVGQQPSGGEPSVPAPERLPERPSVEQPVSKPSPEPAEPEAGAERGKSERFDELAPTERPRIEKREEETAGQVAYEPSSVKTQGLGTLVPVNMKSSTSDALNRLKQKRGSIDAYVADRLGYKIDDLAKYFSAEQVDALGLAIDNIEKGAGFIIGDQTGIGKGRVNAGIIRYALRHKMIPIFTTEKPNLYGDMYRDMVDIGVPEMLKGKNKEEKLPRILMTNSNETVPLDEDGLVTLKTKTNQEQILKQFADQKSIGDYHMVFTTYNQMQTVKGKKTERQRFLESIAPNSLLILDESHNAGGTGGEAGEEEELNRARFVRNLVGMAKAVFYSSATYAKRPDVMDLYYKTDMSKAVSSPDALAEAISKGGIPMQQVVASMLAKSGQYIRRERSFAGVTYDARVVDVDRKTYDNFCNALTQIQRFSNFVGGVTKKIAKEIREEAKTLSPDGSIGAAGAESVNFTSSMHNLVSQMLLGMKVKPAVNLAIEALKEGKKPVLTVSSTMESFLQEIQEESGMKAGDAIKVDFGDLLIRYLERNRVITIKRPFSAEKAKKLRLTDAQLGPGGVEMFNAIKEYVKALDLSGLPLSPIDYMKNELEKRGYKIGEITGRGLTIDYSGKVPVLSSRPSSELKIAGRRATINGFNNADTDAIILNQAGATGLSLHASSKFKNQQQREMILVQPEANIDTHMQMLGRIHRTGQVRLPSYIQMIANIPAEKRPAAILAKKMASLSANTTGARKGALSAENVPDFLNEYGDQVAAAFLIDNPEMPDRLDVKVQEDKKNKDADNSDLMRKMTGRLVLLPLKEQEEAYQDLETRYNDLMKQLEAQGVNTLEAKTLDLDAKLLDEKLAKEGDDESPFTASVYYGQYDVKRQGKPITMRDAINKVVEANELQNIPDDDLKALEYLRKNVPLYDKYQKIYDNAIKDFRDYERSVLDDTDPDRMQKEADRLSLIRNAFNTATSMIRPGRRIRVTAPNGETSIGLIVNVSRGGKTKNPLALGDWRVTFALPSAHPMLTMPFSQLQIGGDIGTKTVLSEPSWADKEETTIKIFDDLAKSDVRDKRVIATGNILAGFDLLNGKGTIINFTTNTGDIRQGIMLPVSVKSIDQALGSSKVVLDTGKKVIDYLFKDNKPKELKTPKLDMLIKARYGRAEFFTQRAKNKGGKYYLDKKIVEIAGFTSSGKNLMTTTIYQDTPKLEQFIDRLIELGARFEVEGQQPKAQYAALQQLQPKAKAEAQDLYEDLRKIVERTIGDKAGLEFVKSISMEDANAAVRSGGVAKGEAAGLYDDMAGIIYLATDLEKGASPEDAVYHEAWHVIQKFLTDEERAALDKARPKNAVAVAKFYGVPVEKILAMPPDEQDAYAMGMFGSMMDAGIKIPEGSLPRSVYETLNKGWLLWKRFRNAVNKFLGDRDAQSVFTDFYFGAMRDRMRETAKDLADKLGVEEPDISYMAIRRKRKKSGIYDISRSDFGAKWHQRLTERYIDLKDWMTAVEKARGAPIEERSDAYLATQLFTDRAVARQEDIWTQEVKPILDMMKKEDVSSEEIGKYLYARHAEERNAVMAQRDPTRFGKTSGGSGLTNDEAQQILDDLQAAGKTPALQKIAKMVYSMLRKDVMQRQSANLLSDAQVEQYTAPKSKGGYEYYVPLMGFAEDEELAENIPNYGKGFAIFGKEFKEATGRESEARNPLFNAINKRMEGAMRIEKQRVTMRLARFIAENPNPDFAKIVRGVNMPKKRILGADGTVTYVPDVGVLRSETTLPYKVKGVPSYIVFNDNNPNMVRLVRELKNLDQSSEIVRAIANFSRIFSKLQTQWVPDFFLVNFPRDVQDAMVSMFSTKENFASQFLIQMKNSSRIIAASNLGKTLSKEDQQILDEWRRSGGKLDYGGFENLDRIVTKVQTELNELSEENGATAKAMAVSKKAVKNLINGIELINDTFENTVRLAVYMAARKNGYSPEKASQLSRRATVDFRAGGAWKPVLNALYPFAGASIGGIRGLYRALRSGRGQGLLGAIVLLAIINALLGSWMSDDDDEDKTKKKYWTQVKSYERQNSLILPIKVGDHYVKIPLGFFLQPFWALGDQIAGVMTGNIKPMDAATTVANSFISAFNPLGNGSIVHNILPLGLRNLAEVWFNRDWLDHKMHPEKEGVPKSQQYFAKTEEWAKTLADDLNRLTGGDRYHSGLIDIYPSNLQYWKDTVTGMLGSFVGTSYKAIENTINGLPTPLEKIPGVRRFVTSTQNIDSGAYFDTKKSIADDMAILTRANKDLNDRSLTKEQRDEASKTVKELSKELGTQRTQRGISSPLSSIPGIIRKTDDDTKKIESQINTIKNNPNLSNAEKAEKIKPLEDKMNDLRNKARRRILEMQEKRSQSPLNQLAQ